MKSDAFDYVRPATLTDAVTALRDLPDATIIAGGQTLLPMLNLRITSAETLVDISRLPELKDIIEHEDHVFIGALTTHAMIEDILGADPSHGLMARIASKIAYRAVRNVGTIGGSLALADPAADWPVCLLALDAVAIVASLDGERAIKIDDFLEGTYETALTSNEILTGINVPKLPVNCWGVGKVARKSGAFSTSLAVAVLPDNGQPARIALGATDSRAQLLRKTADLFDLSHTPDPQELNDAILQDIGDVHEEATPYQRRCHLNTVLSAILEARR